MSLADLSTRAEAITALLVLCGVLLGYLRWVRPRIRSVVRTGNAVVDTLVGRDAITDPVTGRELAPAQPGIGVRMAKLEDAISTLAHQDRRIVALETTVDDLGRRMVAQEQASVERAVTRAESLTHLAMLAKAQGIDPAEVLAEPESES